jgi:hypothetical protein
MRALMVVPFLIACGGNGAVDAEPDAAAPVIDGAEACTKPPVFINMLPPDGETYTPGLDDARVNRSQMLAAPVTVMPMQGDTAAVVTAARALLEPHGITVTDVDPGATPHVEIVVVGDPWPFASSFTALAPSRCTLNPNAIAMINEFAGRKADDLAVSIAFVLGVVTGLEYSDGPGNCMALSASNACTFSDASPVVAPPRCPDVGATQDQIAILSERLGC